MSNVSAQINSSALVPRDKHDFERLNALITAGPSAAIPILDELLVWLQDINWPIASPLADFLVNVGEPLVPHLKKILSSGDEMWIYWVLSFLIKRLPAELIHQLSFELEALATAAENHILALRIGNAAHAWDIRTLRRLVNNNLSAYEDYVCELRAIQLSLPTE